MRKSLDLRLCLLAPHLDSLGLRATFWVNGNSIEQGEVNL